MGSTGSGSFSDYHGYNGGNSGENGGESGNDQCIRAFSTSLDEVASSDFYIKTKSLPIEGTEVIVVFDKRLLVVDKSGSGIGYLPTRYNYLRACMHDGFTYEGVINKATTIPIPSIIVDIMPEML